MLEIKVSGVAIENPGEVIFQSGSGMWIDLFKVGDVPTIRPFAAGPEVAVEILELSEDKMRFRLVDGTLLLLPEHLHCYRNNFISSK